MAHSSDAVLWVGIERVFNRLMRPHVPSYSARVDHINQDTVDNSVRLSVTAADEIDMQMWMPVIRTESMERVTGAA